MKPLCIYHGNCADGFTAAWCVWKALAAGQPEGIELHAGTYGDPPPNVRGRDVIIVDFSYKRDVIDRMSKQANTLLILDHHKSAIEELADHLPTPAIDATYDGFLKSPGSRRVGARFNLNRSGAGLAWEFFHPGKPSPHLVSYVEDRDLWRFQLPMSRAINANLSSYAFSLATWEQLYWDLQDGAKLQRFAQGGDAVLRKLDKDVRELIATLRRTMRIGGHDVPVINVPKLFASEAANLMAAEAGVPFAACYHDTATHRVFELRAAFNLTDVAEIAAKYGGGGHKNAAGFRIPLGKLGELA